MSSKLPWFPFYAKDFISDGDISVMTNDELGGYIRLMCHDWIEGGLRYTEDEMRELAKFSKRQTNVKRVFDKFIQVGDVRTHPKLAEIRAEQEAKIEKCREAGRKGANAKADAIANAKADAERTD